MISVWMPPVGVGVDEAVEGDDAEAFEGKVPCDGSVEGDREGGGGGGPCG